MPNSRMAGGMSAPVGGVSRETLLSFAVPDLQIERNSSSRNGSPRSGSRKSGSRQSSSPQNSSRQNGSRQNGRRGGRPHADITLGQQALAVFLGGLLGTAIRAGLSFLQPSAKDAAGLASWPWVTFLINLSGAFLLGFYFEFLARTGEDHGWRKAFRLCFGTGTLGAFTTYGTFILEDWQRLSCGSVRAVVVGVGYALVSVIGGLLLAGLGIALARALSRPSGDGASSDAVAARKEAAR